MAPTRTELLKEIQHRRALGSPGMVILATLDIPHSETKSSIGHSLRSKIIQLGNTPPNSIVAYSARHVLIITDDAASFTVTQELTRIGEFLTSQHLGSISTRAFHIPNESHLVFAALEMETDGEAHLLQTTEFSPTERVKDVDSLLEIERMLRDADLSNIIRERPVYDFGNRNAPKLVQSELIVDMAEIGRLAQTGFRGKAWLFTEVAGLLDRRVLAYLLRHHSHDDDRLSINLLIRTVLSDEFDTFQRQISQAMVSRLACELDFHEIQAFPKAGADAVRKLRDAGMAVVVDAVPIEQLDANSRELPAITGQYKFDWRSSLALDSEAFQPDAYLRDRTWRLATLGAEKCVLLHCHTPRVIENALALGFTQLEGFEVTQYVRSHPQFRDLPIQPPITPKRGKNE